MEHQSLKKGDKASVHSQNDTEPVNSKAARILVVEDDLSLWPFWENVLKDVLPRAEIDWETTERTAEGLLKHRFNKNSPYDLVISDIFLEGHETGIDLWTRYGEAAKNFIFVSGMPAKKFDSLMNMNFGYQAYLEKPLNARKCREAVRSAMEQSSS